VTEVERVSFYNTGLFFWPGDATKLGFQALIGSGSNPFQMDRDGRNKRDLTKGSKEFAYGFSASPDGKRIAYHKNYQVYLADADGANARRVETGQPFNFSPRWSPDGLAVLFVSGEHYHCHPYVVRADGSDLKKLADRGGYRGVVEFLDVPDFHGGSSDVPVWSSDGRSVYYTAQVQSGAAPTSAVQGGVAPTSGVELFRVTLDGKSQRLTESPAGTLHYHPLPSPDGQWLVYGSKRSGVRQLYLMRLEDRKEYRLTSNPAGRAAMWPHWQPAEAGDKRGSVK
jgi:Tol biopolymer transport system component